MNKFLFAIMLVGSLFLAGCDDDKDESENAFVTSPNSCPQGYVITMKGCQKVVTLPKDN